jgi:dolichol-phosphate mannosyltransferase
MINELMARLVPICEHIFEGSYEILLINDGSTDQTWPLICAHAADSARVVGIDLARNHGHQLALTAGLAESRGELVLVIDADLQDPPELLSKMLEKIAQGYDVVYGQRIQRRGETLFKRATAAGFYRLLDKLIDISIPQDTGDFRLMTRRVVDQLNAMPESYRFIRGMVSWVGFNQTGIAYERDARFAGTSNYPLRRMLALAFDGITGFSTVPLRLASHLGIAFGVAALAMLGWVLHAYVNHGAVTGWASTMTVVLVLGSAQLLILGVIGEYLGRMYMESKRRPLFIVREIRRARAIASLQWEDAPRIKRVENVRN